MHIQTSFNKYLLLNESSFYDIKRSDILSDKYFSDFKRNSEYDNLLEYYIDNIYSGDDEEDVENSEEFKEYIIDYFSNLYDDAHENIYYCIDDNDKIKIYRAITVDDNWLHHLKIQGKRLGIYWSWSVDGAETHWGDYEKKNMAVITAEIDQKYVDWETTFQLNVDPTLYEEKEIRLYKNTTLDIKSIHLNGKEIDLSIFKNKKFIS